MQDSCSARRCDHRKRTRERSLRRRKTKPSTVRSVKSDPLDLENPDSQLTKSNIKNIITDQVFRSFPPGQQLELAELLPECDKVISPTETDIMSIGPEALNNEFFTKACLEWRERLIDGDFTQETQIRCKLEREKRLHVDEWKKKYFESFWGEKLISATTATMSALSPVISTSAQYSVQKKRQLTDSSIKVKQTVHDPSLLSVNRKKVKEQLSQMLNSRSLHLPKSNEAATTATVTKLSLPDGIGSKSEQSSLEKLTENSDAGLCRISAPSNSVKSCSNHLIKKEQKAAIGSVLLGKRLVKAEKSVDSCPFKRPSITLDDSTKSLNGTKSSGVATLMPILANALLTNDLNKAASFPSCIPNVIQMEKPHGEIVSSLQSKVVSLSKVIRSNSLNISVKNDETYANVAVLPGNAGSRHMELLQKLDKFSSANNAKKNTSVSEGGSCRQLDQLYNCTNVISLQRNDKRLVNTSANQSNFPSNLIFNSGMSVPLINTFVSSAPLFCSTNSNPTSFVPTQTVRWENSILSGAYDALKQGSLKMETGTNQSYNGNPVIISPQEPMFIVQQINPSTNVKQLASSSALPYQTPVIVMLGNPVLPCAAFPRIQTPHVSMTTPKVAINNPTKLIFTNSSEPCAHGVVTQAQQSVMPSGSMLVPGRPTRSPDFKTVGITCSAAPRIIGGSQIAKSISTIAHKTQTSFTSCTTMSACRIGSNSYQVANQAFPKILCINTADVTEPAKLNWKNPIGTDVRMQIPLVIANKQHNRIVSSSIPTTRTCLSTSCGSPTPGILASYLKNSASMCPTLLAARHPPVLPVITNQHPRLLVALSEANSQNCCAGKNSSKTLPIHYPQSVVLKSLDMSKAEGQFTTDPIVTLRQTEPFSVRKPCTSGVPSVTCSTLPSVVENVSTSTTVPLFLIQSPLLKAGPLTSETTISLNTRSSDSSMLNSNYVSSLITMPSQNPLVFQVLHDGAQTIEPQNIVLNMMPMNGTVALNMTHDIKKECDKVKHPTCFLSSCSVTACSSTNEAKSISTNANLMNGSKMKMITIKKISIPQPPSCHFISSGQQIQVHTGSLIKTLLSVQEPPVVQAVGNSDGLTSAFLINKAITSHTEVQPSLNVHLTAAVGTESGIHKVCSRCGSLDFLQIQNEMERGIITSNSSSICVACQTLV